MTDPNKLYKTGFIIRTHGKDGEVLVHDEEGVLTEAQPEFIFISIDRLPVPFRIEKTKQTGSELLMKLKNVNNAEDAEILCKKDVLVDKDALEDFLPEEDGLEGYRLFDGKREIGTIDYVDHSTANELFVLEDGSLIPAHPDLIEDIDDGQRIVICRLPEGLTN